MRFTCSTLLILPLAFLQCEGQALRRKRLTVIDSLDPEAQDATALEDIPIPFADDHPLPDASEWELALRELIVDGSMSLPPPTNAPIAPVAPPTDAPVVPPTDVPVVPPTGAPVLPPSDAPVVPPTDAPTPFPTPSPTPAPTPSPTPSLCVRDEEAFLLQELDGLVSPGALQDPSTPQGQALAWLVNQDTFDICTAQPSQRFALVAFYFATNGDSWTNNQNWLTSVSECEWFGVSCAEDLIESLSLENNNLDGPIPPEFTLLTSLQSVAFLGNNLQGPIPNLMPLVNLQSFDVEGNSFTGVAVGPLPVSIRQYLVSGNQLDGTIPGELLANLPNLENLWLLNNTLSGTIPDEISQATSLSLLYLTNNLLTGTIPASLETLPNLRQLFVGGNLLEGTVPPALFQLEQVRVENNRLSGTIGEVDPTIITNLWIENNDFTGPIPASLETAQLLENFPAQNNLLTGTIPPIQAFALEFFDVRNNELTGTIPSSLFEPSLEILYLAGNRLTGPIPPRYAEAISLEDFWISNNTLTGTVPPVAAGQLPALTEFLLEGNEIIGTMPQGVCDLRTGLLEDLWSDCEPPPEIQCDLGTCCTRCFSLP